MNMCTLSCSASFLALVTAASGLAWSSSTMNFTSMPPSLPPCSSRYIWKPLTMSLPTWAKMPVIGAMKPMRSSSARAFDGMVSAAANTPPSKSAVALRESPLVIRSPSRSAMPLPVQRGNADACGCLVPADQATTMRMAGGSPWRGRVILWRRRGRKPAGKAGCHGATYRGAKENPGRRAGAFMVSKLRSPTAG